MYKYLVAGISIVIFSWSIIGATIIILEEDVVNLIRESAGSRDEGQSDFERIQALTAAIGRFSEPRREFADSNGVKIQALILQFSPILSSLAYGGGACGYATEIGVRVMEKEGFDARFIQVMNSRGNTCHVAMDVGIGGGATVVIDPIFGYCFTDETALPMDAKRIGREWSRLVHTLPEKKIRKYSYEHGVLYTNWDKNGLTRGLRKCLMFLHVDHEAICLRKHYNALRRAVPFGPVSFVILGFFIFMCHGLLRFRFPSDVYHTQGNEAKDEYLAPMPVEVLIYLRAIYLSIRK